MLLAQFQPGKNSQHTRHVNEKGKREREKVKKHDEKEKCFVYSV